MRVVKVTDQVSGKVIGNQIQVAETSLSRMRGLLGREGLDAGAGLWIKPSSGVHTVAMKFSIDVIGLDSERRVIKLWQNLVPCRVTSVHRKMRSVMELAAGSDLLLIEETPLDSSDKSHDRVGRQGCEHGI